MYSDWQTPQSFPRLPSCDMNVGQQLDSIAMVCGNDHYFCVFANQFAHRPGWYLQVKRVGQEHGVGRCLEHAFEPVLAILDSYRLEKPGNFDGSIDLATPQTITE